MATQFSTSARFRDGDPRGILFFGRAYELAHDAFEDFTLKIGYSYREWFENEAFGFPFRKSECEHLRPIRPGDKIDISVSVDAIGDSSFTSVYDMKVAGNTVCVVRLMHVCVDNSMKKMSLPSEIRSRLEAHKL